MASDFSSWLFAQASPELTPDVQGMLTALPPRLEMAWDPVGETWQLVWPNGGWLLQETSNLDSGWRDVSPPPTSPYPLATDGDQRHFRLLESKQADRQAP